MTISLKNGWFLSKKTSFLNKNYLFKYLFKFIVLNQVLLFTFSKINLDPKSAIQKLRAVSSKPQPQLSRKIITMLIYCDNFPSVIKWQHKIENK